MKRSPLFHGINVPLLSLRSKKSSGVGEFYDLLPMIDWCSSIGMNVIQLLPLNDSGYDTSPYNAISSLALHPIYISLHALKNLALFPKLKSKLRSFKKYSRTQRVVYDDVLRMKMDFLYQYYLQMEPHYKKNSSFIQFQKKHPWIKLYSLFKILKEKHNLASWKKWPSELKNPTQQMLSSLYKKYAREIHFHFFVQYTCYEQLIKVKNYAHRKGISLMGDIPILISTESVDVWADRNLFNMRYAAGSPPDEFNKNGQYWGFPIFDWKAMKATDYAWWKRRLTFAQNFYDIFRIDHVIGFYRIWAIPLNELPAKGHFIPAKEKEFTRLGHTSLKKMLSFTTMHPIGEDLGSLPTPLSVEHSLKTLKIDRTIVLRWEKYRSNGKYIPFEKYPFGSYSTVSTHDSEPLSQWMRDYPKEAKQFFKFRKIPYQKTLTKAVRTKILTEMHQIPCRFHINLLQEYLALFKPLVWPCLDDERINRPGFILPTNWTYRFRPSIETITTHPQLKNSMKKIISCR